MQMTTKQRHCLCYCHALEANKKTPGIAAGGLMIGLVRRHDATATIIP